MAGHVATLPGFGTVIMTTPELEVSGIPIPKIEKQADLVSSFKKISGEARAALAGLTGEQLGQMWTFKRQGKTIFSLPRYDAVRSMFFNHIIHHRAQLTMYLRTLNVPVPALYGPSADENPFG